MNIKTTLLVLSFVLIIMASSSAHVAGLTKAMPVENEYDNQSEAAKRSPSHTNVYGGGKNEFQVRVLNRILEQVSKKDMKSNQGMKEEVQKETP